MKSTTFFLSFMAFTYLNAQKAVVSTPNTIVVYKGIQNPVDVFYPGVTVKDLVIKEYKGCEITKTGAQYFVKPISDVTNCSFIIGIRSGRTIRWVDTAILPVRNLPKGEARFGELSNGSYTLSEILRQEKLTYYTDAYFKDFGGNITITQFRVIFMPKVGYMEEMSSADASISREIKEHLSKLKSGDMIVIDDIKVIISGNEMRLLPITITVYETIYYNPTISIESYQEQAYKLDSINDSTYYYESYFPDGKIYQQGNVLTDTKYREYHLLKLNSKNQYPFTEEPYQKHLMSVQKGYYPISEWNIFDSAGHHRMTINYNATRDSISTIALKETPNIHIINYTIAVDGQCIFYKSDGVIEKILYYRKGVKK